MWLRFANTGMQRLMRRSGKCSGPPGSSAQAETGPALRDDTGSPAIIALSLGHAPSSPAVVAAGLEGALYAALVAFRHALANGCIVQSNSAKSPRCSGKHDLQTLPRGSIN